jgi:hypothetical protein
MAQGNGGQTLLLFPEHELLVVTMAGYYNDIANMILFTCSDAGAKISGQALSVDGNTETLNN